MSEIFKPSVTVAAIIEQGGRFFMVEERTPEGLRINNPAGHMEQGESPFEACVRETLEETAHHFRPTALVGVYMSRFERPSTGEDITYLRFAFCGELGAHEPTRALGLADEGIERTLWMTLAELEQSQERHRSPLVLRCAQDYLAGKRLALDAVYVDASVARLGMR
jgi:phosphatase NudJ